MQKDYYRILEVNPRASRAVIDAAYNVLSRRYLGQAYLTEIQEAYATLSDSARKNEYDQSRIYREGNIIGNYEIVEHLKEGSLGQLYLAKHILNEEEAVIKHCSDLSPQKEELLVAESKKLWNLIHYGLPTMKDLIQLEDGTLALVMRYIRGESLEKTILDRARVNKPPENAEDVAWKAERVLNIFWYLHLRGVLHGRLSPRHIVVEHETHDVFLVGFGLSNVNSGIEMSSDEDRLFMSPERSEGKPLLPESDFYSLARVMQFALGGGYDAVRENRVPKNLPIPMKNFMVSLLKSNIFDRPNWETTNLFEEIQKVRRESFGRYHSNLK